MQTTSCVMTALLRLREQAMRSFSRQAQLILALSSSRHDPSQLDRACGRDWHRERHRDCGRCAARSTGPRKRSAHDLGTRGIGGDCQDRDLHGKNAECWYPGVRHGRDPFWSHKPTSPRDRMELVWSLRGDKRFRPAKWATECRTPSRYGYPAKRARCRHAPPSQPSPPRARDRCPRAPAIETRRPARSVRRCD